MANVKKIDENQLGGVTGKGNDAEEMVLPLHLRILCFGDLWQRMLPRGNTLGLG